MVPGPAAAAPKEDQEFDEAQIFFEFNSTDLDLGLHIFFDALAWEKVEVQGPDGVIFRVDNKGGLKEVGSTEVATESAEPPLDESDLEDSIAAFQAKFPEGEYIFSGTTITGDNLTGEAELSHDLPAPVSIDASGFPTITWTDESEPGDPEIVGYQAVVELVVDDGGEERVFQIQTDLPASTTSLTAPAEFVALLGEFDVIELKVEVIAIGDNGNKTITEEILIEAEE
jgi:hypothetical protein